jgi:hypothetical protein
VPSALDLEAHGVRWRGLSTANWNPILLAAAPIVNACGGGTRPGNRRELHRTASLILVSVSLIQQINTRAYFFAVNGHCGWFCQKERENVGKHPIAQSAAG